MDRLPLFLDLRDVPVVLVGGGEVAERKARLLASAGARLTIVAPDLSPVLAARVERGEARHVPGTFEPQHLDGARLAVAATSDIAVNEAVAAAARERNVWVNVVDDAERSTAIVPSLVDRSPVIVAISTGGASPVLARRLRERIERLLEDSLGPLAALLARWRPRLLERWPRTGERRRAIEALIDGDVGRLVAGSRVAEAERALERAVARPRERGIDAAPRRGFVSLVGAGPGDPGLLTLRGLRALQDADVVLHDRLVSAGVLALARRDAQIIEVGKSGGGPSTSQEAIHALLLVHARAGRRVVRLKGGDPNVFGRGGEEAEILRAAGIPFEFVPGITSALALAGAGIPLTHRGLSAGVRFVTPQRAADGTPPDWRAWAQSPDTLVVYMGGAALVAVRDALLAHGRDAATPVALVENVSRPEQRVLVGTLGEAAALAHDHTPRAPALLVIGAVAALASRLHSFGTAPLEPRHDTAEAA
jgi:uroporphyrin-III C-methyltransferase/precorrin-2 dehydrogenase/sirohydrochlorin ferrochelatase